MSDPRPYISSWTLRDRVRQHLAAGLYCCRPKRIAGLVPMCRMVLADAMTPAARRPKIPDWRNALSEPDGLAGICPDLDVDTLMSGYRNGFYQVSHAGPHKWWAPRNRMVLFLDQLRLEKNLKRKLRQGKYRITFDTAFDQVVGHCAGHRRGRNIQLTWILPEVASAFQRLHEDGHAHSVEVWDEDGKLAGGLFGVGFGHVFATESQFSHQRDASKIAFAVLNRHLQHWGYVVNDVHRWSAHLAKFGCEEIPRFAFTEIATRYGTGDQWWASWEPIDSLTTGSWDPASGGGWTRQAVLDALRHPADPLDTDGSQEIVADGRVPEWDRQSGAWLYTDTKVHAMSR